MQFDVFGVLGYKTNRTHSILRNATPTTSPVSADALGDQMENLRIRSKSQNAVQTIAHAWHQKHQAFIQELKKQHGLTLIRTSSNRKLPLDVSSAYLCATQGCGFFFLKVIQPFNEGTMHSQ